MEIDAENVSLSALNEIVFYRLKVAFLLKNIIISCLKANRGKSGRIQRELLCIVNRKPSQTNKQKKTISKISLFVRFPFSDSPFQIAAKCGINLSIFTVIPNVVFIHISDNRYKVNVHMYYIRICIYRVNNTKKSLRETCIIVVLIRFK